MDIPFDGVAFRAAYAQMMEFIRPIAIERLVVAQENPATRFVEVVGGEPVIDFGQLWNVLFNPESES